MFKLLLVGAGGFFGSIFRYLASEAFVRSPLKQYLPYGTLSVNILGCFLIGLINGIMGSGQTIASEIRLPIMVGFLGGFTTFSSFSLETMKLFKEGETGLCLLNAALHFIFCLAGVWLGDGLGKHF